MRPPASASVVFLLVSACSFNGAAVSEDDDGQTEDIDAGRQDPGADAARDGSPTAGDRDDDGIDDDFDNCIDTPNALQHDEDSDQVGDVCDNAHT